MNQYVEVMGFFHQDVKRGISVHAKIKVELGFLNDKVPTTFHRKPVYISLLTERSDGFLIDFRRIR